MQTDRAVKNAHRTQRRTAQARRAIAFRTVQAMLLGLPAGLHASPTLAQTSADAPRPVAQEPSSDVVADIIVTAQRRSERLQDVPIAITAVSAEQIGRQGIATTAELAQAVPGLVFHNPANVAAPYIRGVGSNLIDPTSESPVAVYVDDVYIASPQANLFTLSNVRQIDVLKGPQGTLFGRNATGGVIQVQTLEPSQELTVKTAVTFGSYEFVSVPAYISGGLADGVATDLAVLYENQGKGYGRNIITGSPTNQQALHNISLRNKWLIDVLPSTTIRLAADYSDLANTNAYQKPQGAFSPIDGTTYLGRFRRGTDIDDRTEARTGGVSIKLDHDFGPVTLTSISAYRRFKGLFRLDDDATRLPIIGLELYERFRNVSQEFRLGKNGGDRFNWIVGGYYYKANGGLEPLLVNGAPAIPSARQRTESYAAFGQATIEVLPRTKLTGGVRFTDERQRFSFAAAGLNLSQGVDKITYRVAVDHHFSPGAMVYASYNTGFKSGGYNLSSPGNAFKPEELKAIEVGAKLEFLDRMVRLNISGFHYDYRNQQLLLPTLASSIVTNAAATKTDGVEATFDVTPSRMFRLSGGVNAMRSKYSRYPGRVALDSNGVASAPFDAKGNRAIASPDFTANLSASLKHDTGVGTFEGSVGGQYNSGYYWEPDNRLRQPEYVLINASLSWTPDDGGFGVKIWAKNLLDTDYYVSRLTVPFPVGDAQIQAPPATVGFTLSFHN